MKIGEARIFLCYASEDKSHIIKIYDKLKAEGLNPWMDEKNLLPGQHWQKKIQETIKASSFMIIFFSKISVSKRSYVQKEFKVARNTLDEIPENQIFVIPVRLDDCQIPTEFRHLHYVDLFKEGGFDHVIKTIRSQSANTLLNNEIEKKDTHKITQEISSKKKHYSVDRSKALCGYWEGLAYDLEVVGDDFFIYRHFVNFDKVENQIKGSLVEWTYSIPKKDIRSRNQMNDLIRRIMKEGFDSFGNKLVFVEEYSYVEYGLLVKLYDPFFLKIEYQVINKNIWQFGIFFLKLSANSKSLDGKFVGFASERQDICGGEIKWQKVKKINQVKFKE